MTMRRVTYAPAQPWTGRTWLTLGAIAAALVLFGGRFPTWAYGTLVLAGLYLVLTNASATSRAITYLTDPKS